MGNGGMSDTKPREWLIAHYGPSHMVNGPHTDGSIAVVPKEAYEQAIRERDEGRVELERLKDTPGGKRIYAALNAIAEQDSLLAECEQALRTIHKWAIEGGAKLAKIDLRHPLIGHLYEFERASGEALAKLKSHKKAPEGE